MRKLCEIYDTLASYLQLGRGGKKHLDIYLYILYIRIIFMTMTIRVVLTFDPSPAGIKS